MFRNSSTQSQTSLFTSTSVLLSSKSLKVYEGNESWHNQFRRQVVDRIDENIFRPLFSEGQGSPNAPIRILTGMMILKESQGWSDCHLFEQCEFNLLVRRALGLFNMDDTVPVASTYYLFRKRIVEWESTHNENLFEKSFSQITKSQCVEFEVGGKNIRMDSKLISSNIAWYSRYELIHETLRKVHTVLGKSIINLSLSESDLNLFNSVSGESGDKFAYRHNKAELENRMVELGLLIYKIIKQTEDHQSDALRTLRRLFNEQYHNEDGVINPLPKSEIDTSSVQSPHDTECHYRQKEDQKVKGYSVNITETCDTDSKMNLITNVLVDTATAADCDYLIPAVEATSAIVTDKIETANADGAYHSVENQEYCSEKEIDFVISAIQGKPSRYDLSLVENGDLIVTDLQTNTILPARKILSRNGDGIIKWSVSIEKNKYRYFTHKEIDTCLLRKHISTRAQEELNVRNNVEASIFQLGYHYSNNKSRYRGLSKHKFWANLRCLWINFVRILKFIIRSGYNCVGNTKKALLLSKLYTQNTKNWLFLIYFFCFGKNYLKTIKIFSRQYKFYKNGFKIYFL